jgi:predicted ATPase
MYRFDARQMAQPASLSDQRRFCMDIDGFGLATLLDDINSNDPKTFLRINEKFCEYLPQYHSVRIRSEKAVTRHWENNQYRASFGDQTGKGIHLEMGKNTFIGARQSSDGAILFLGFLALANLPDPPRLLLIEEPENGIYPKRIEQVVDLLRRFSEEGSAGKCPQIVMTTHSPYVLSHFKPEEVTFLSRRKDGTVQARPLKDAPNISQRLSGFYLGELWYNLSEQELFTDAPAEIGD